MSGRSKRKESLNYKVGIAKNIFTVGHWDMLE